MFESGAICVSLLFFLFLKSPTMVCFLLFFLFNMWQIRICVVVLIRVERIVL